MWDISSWLLQQSAAAAPYLGHGVAPLHSTSGPSQPLCRLGADCGSDHELLIAKFELKLKKVGKTTRPFRYDLNQILYNYTVEVRNRFKGLDLTDRVPDKLWTEVQETGIKTIPTEEMQSKMAV